MKVTEFCQTESTDILTDLLRCVRKVLPVCHICALAYFWLCGLRPFGQISISINI
ncbi:hypothetical protein BACCOPRO_02398 [Phocaeicola coprophilus DSM 18228 = JCM 13818]|uniref:Uncharacterized protein n=1 Tax=Phocaeicola coprophilus DSM 18228 = JCM 13818 TaxID=547042 RepID=S0FAR3_9BACT|nr:hypothetical protein BACCOPRO_02398 [Phocaeicola coprophilus DSM 18228 = JCM 13818]